MKRNHTGHSKAILAAAVALVALLVAPSLAHAVKLPITGGSMFVQLGPTPLPYPYPTAGGSVNPYRTPVYATVGKTTPKQLTLPTSAFQMPFLYNYFVPLSNPYLYFSSQGNMYGPVGGPAVFKAGPKTTRPAAFAWCANGGGPACTAQPTTGKPGLVRYSPGGSQFGGTMQIFVSTIGQTVAYLGYTGPTMIHYPLTGTLSGGAGGAYANTVTLVGANASITYAPVIVSRRIQTPGSPVGSYSGYSATYTGFPFTTGMVTAQVIRAGTTGSPDSTITGTGSDSRTALGKGNITMVAGGLAHSPGRFSVPIVVFMVTVVPEPVLLLQLASGLLGLALLDKRRRRANR
jgi:hypothetical protein